MRRLAILGTLVVVALGTLGTRPANADYAGEVLSDNPIGYWRLGEAAGSTAFDASGNMLNGTYNGSLAMGQAGAVRFDSDTAVNFGSNGDVFVSPDMSLNQLTNNFTIEAWVKGGNGWVVSTRQMIGSNAGYGLAAKADSGEVRLTTFGVKDYVLSGQSLPSDEWTHVAVALDSSNDATFYIDGLFVETIEGLAPAAASPQPLTIARSTEKGQDGTFGYYNGYVDEVAVYGSVLSADRIWQHYQTASVPEPSLAVLCSSGLAGLLVCLWRRRKRRA